MVVATGVLGCFPTDVVREARAEAPVPTPGRLITLEVEGRTSAAVPEAPVPTPALLATPEVEGRAAAVEPSPKPGVLVVVDPLVVVGGNIDVNI